MPRDTLDPDTTSTTRPTAKKAPRKPGDPYWAAYWDFDVVIEARTDLPTRARWVATRLLKRTNYKVFHSDLANGDLKVKVGIKELAVMCQMSAAAVGEALTFLRRKSKDGKQPPLLIITRRGNRGRNGKPGRVTEYVFNRACLTVAATTTSENSGRVGPTVASTTPEKPGLVAGTRPEKPGDVGPTTPEKPGLSLIRKSDTKAILYEPRANGALGGGDFDVEGRKAEQTVETETVAAIAETPQPTVPRQRSKKSPRQPEVTFDGIPPRPASAPDSGLAGYRHHLPPDPFYFKEHESYDKLTARHYAVLHQTYPDTVLFQAAALLAKEARQQLEAGQYPRLPYVTKVGKQCEEIVMKKKSAPPPKTAEQRQKEDAQRKAETMAARASADRRKIAQAKYVELRLPFDIEGKRRSGVDPDRIGLTFNLETQFTRLIVEDGCDPEKLVEAMTAFLAQHSHPPKSREEWKALISAARNEPAAA